MHVFPRFHGDPFRLVADWDEKPPRSALDKAAAKIGAAYQSLYGDEE